MPKNRYPHPSGLPETALLPFHLDADIHLIPSIHLIAHVKRGGRLLPLPIFPVTIIEHQPDLLEGEAPRLGVVKVGEDEVEGEDAE